MTSPIHTVLIQFFSLILIHKAVYGQNLNILSYINSNSGENINTDIIHANYHRKIDEEKSYCGSDSIISKLSNKDFISEIRWKKSDPKPYYNNCKVIHARYNCTRFHNNSAADYRLDYPFSHNCIMPNYYDLDILLTKAKNSLNVLFLGDSHVMQLFQSLLCIYQEKLENISLYHTDYNKSTIITDKNLNLTTITHEVYDRIEYKNYSLTPSCHSVRFKDYRNYYLQSSRKNKYDPGRCEISHSPGQLSCFYISPKHHLFCAAFIRPLSGLDAVKAGLYDAIINNNYSLNTFSAIVTNSYVNSSDLGNYLQHQKYTGRVIVLPRYPDTNQVGFRFNSPYISNSMYSVKNDVANSIKLLSKEIKEFCSIVNSKFQSQNYRLGCIYLDYTDLIAIRSVDAKASIFPMGIYDKELKIWNICQANSTDNNKCPGHDYRVCSDELLPCSKESHFCLPGPTDEFSLLLLSAIINESNYQSIN